MDDEDDRVRPVGYVRASAPARMAADYYDSERSRTWLMSPPRRQQFTQMLERVRARKAQAEAPEPHKEPVDRPLADSGTLGRLLDTEA